MKGFEGGVNMTHNRARMSDPHDHHNQTIKGGEAVQDRSKTADLLSSCLQDTQKKTDLQWSERPNRLRSARLRPAIRWMSFGFIAQSGCAVGQRIDNTMPVTATSPALDQGTENLPATDAMTNILNNHVILPPLNVDQLGMPQFETQNYTQQLALPKVVIQYQDVATGVWNNQLNIIGYSFLIACVVVAIQVCWQRQLDRGLAGLVIIFALGFALLMVRVKLAA
ncbi:MAG: hypothetical protein RLY58_1619 [Pseudomonadota bacterium]|jgi:hypothetical protein